MFSILLAQVPNFDNGSHSKATVDAAELAKAIGPVWFFAVVCLVAFLALVVGFGWLLWKFGGKLLTRLEEFLAGVSTTNAENVKSLELCSKVCYASSVNVANLCDAGHNFANAVNKIGKEMGADVTEECEKIHEKLRTIITTERNHA